MAAPSAPPSRARASSRSTRPGISRTWSSRRFSPIASLRSPAHSFHPEIRPMRVYHFTEQPYPAAWENNGGSRTVGLPNSRMDPKIAGDLFHRYYDEWMLADELGLDIMLNEHHATATCMSSTCIVGLAILARITKRAGRLVLGYPLGHRPHPPRC